MNEDEMKTQYRWGEYVVAYVDILGQTDQMEQIKNFFIADIPQEMLDDVAVITVGAVEPVREMLSELYTSSAKPANPKISVPDQDKAEFERLRATSRINYRFSSDSILAYIELRATGCQLNDWFAIRDILIAVGGAMLGALVMESSFRAAIELGIGTQLADGDLYGPIRAEIYKLEKGADYPRIIIGPRFFDHMKSFSEGRPQIPCITEKEAIGSKNVVDFCMKQVAEDPNDGRLILDYLANDFILKGDPLESEIYSSARGYIEQVIQKRSNIENDKVLGKFLRLRTYFDSRPSRA